MSNHVTDRCTLAFGVDVVSNETVVTAMPISPGKKPLYGRYPSVDELISRFQLPARLLNVGTVTELAGRYQPYAFERSWLADKGLAEAD